MPATDKKQASSSTFHYHIRKTGLYLNRVGIDSIALLERLIREPLPMAPASPRGRTNPHGIALSPLIQHGLAKLDREKAEYVSTPKGVSWLAKVKKERII